MKIETVTTKVHTAVFSADDLKAVALSAVKGQVGVSDDAVASSEVTLGDDGSIKVEIVENVPAAPAADAVDVGTESTSAAAQITIPAGLGGAATA